VGTLDQTSCGGLEKANMSESSRIRADELIGLKVVNMAGKAIGHVHDLRAERKQNQLCVTALMVGPRAWLVKLGIAHGFETEIAWERIVDIGKSIRIRGDGTKVDP
jgi:sporulation protein YlmC with PRC-barrel domain